MALLGIVVQMYLGLVTMFLFLASCTTSSPVRPTKGLGSIGGEINFVSPPSSVRVGAWESDSKIILFPEAQNITLPSDMTVEGGITIPKGTIPKGTTVDVYFMHADSVGRDRRVTLRGSVTFDTEILGVIGSDAGLDATDSVLGLNSTKYPGSVSQRGTTEGVDNWTVSNDSRTLSVTMRTIRRVDQLRVIVRAKQ